MLIKMTQDEKVEVRKSELGMMARKQLRAETSGEQYFYMCQLVKVLKPEWYKEGENGELSYVDQEDCPLNAIREIFSETDKVWGEMGDWSSEVKKRGRMAADAISRYMAETRESKVSEQ